MPAVVLPAVRPYNDFIQCYLTVNSRSRSPIYLYGESYGTPRTNMLALALESAGVHHTGIVQQSSILNYFADAVETTAIENSSAGLKLATTGDQLQQEAQQRIVKRLSANAALSKGGSITKAQAQASGLGYVAKHFDQIDTAHSGQVSISDVQRYVQQRH